MKNFIKLFTIFLALQASRNASAQTVGNNLRYLVTSHAGSLSKSSYVILA